MIRWIISALGYLLLTCTALAQVGQIPAWPPTQFIASGGGCSQATAFIARANAITALDGTHTTAYTNLICGLVTDGVFSKFDVLNIWATQSSGVALLNLVGTSFSPSVASNSPTFTVDRGYTGNGTNTSLSASFNPSTAGGNYTQNSAHYSSWNVTSGNGLWELGTDANTALISNFSANIQMRINDSAASGNIAAASTAGVGHFIASRTSSTVRTGYVNGASIGTTGSATSAAPANANLSFLFVGGQGATSDQVAASSIGGALSGADATNFYNRLRTYMTAVGVP